MTARFMLLLLLLDPWVMAAHADDARLPEILERSASLTALFPPAQVQTLADILPADREVTWKIRVPRTDLKGVLVFVSPTASGDPQSDWPAALDRHGLLWIAATDFGNPVPSNQRVLAALMALSFAEQHYPLQGARRYVGGMSGGGRVASIVITTFPQLFDGALYIVGVDAPGTMDKSRMELIVHKRYVFLTGDGDFNRDEIRHVQSRYRSAGAGQTLLIDLPHFGHQYPRADVFDRAMAFLEGGSQTGN